MTTIGFIGLGNLGAHLASNLLQAGFGVWMHDLDRSTAKELEESGATWAETAADTVPMVDAVITCLPSPAISEKVLEETQDRANQMLMPTMKKHWSVWIPVHTFNFYNFGLHHRVLVQNLVLVGWSGCKCQVDRFLVIASLHIEFLIPYLLF